MSIRDDLRVRISAGEWSPGGRLPSEADLAARYGVARMTIRQAVGALASEGIVVRRQGLGTFAAEQPPARSSIGLAALAEESCTEAMSRQGHDVQTNLIKACVDQPPPAAREDLGLGPSALAVLVQRVRTIDGSPVVVLSSWLPFARFAGLVAHPLLNGSLYAMIEEHYGVRIVMARQRCTAAPADAYNAALLGLQPGDPVLRTVRTAYDSSNSAIEYSTSAMRAGYPIETIMQRQPLVSAERPAGVPQPEGADNIG
jgi:GntR family transcriptional regulator